MILSDYKLVLTRKGGPLASSFFMATKEEAQEMGRLLDFIILPHALTLDLIDQSDEPCQRRNTSPGQQA